MNEREKMHCYVQSDARLVGPTMFNIFTIMPPNIVTQKSLPNSLTIVALIYSGPRNTYPHDQPSKKTIRTLKKFTRDPSKNPQSLVAKMEAYRKEK